MIKNFKPLPVGTVKVNATDAVVFIAYLQFIECNKCIMYQYGYSYREVSGICDMDGIKACDVAYVYNDRLILHGVYTDRASRINKFHNPVLQPCQQHKHYLHDTEILKRI